MYFLTTRTDGTIAWIVPLKKRQASETTGQRRASELIDCFVIETNTMSHARDYQECGLLSTVWMSPSCNRQV